MFIRNCALIGTIIGFLGCGGLEQQAGLGATAGIATAKAAEKVKKAFEIKVPLDSVGISVCGKVEGGEEITCFLSPCEKNCETTFANAEVFFESVGRASLLELTIKQYNRVEAYCKRKPEECRKKAPQFDGYHIILKDRR